MPYHIMLDTYREEEKGGTQIGTNQKELVLLLRRQNCKSRYQNDRPLNPEVLKEKKKNLKQKFFSKIF